MKRFMRGMGDVDPDLTPRELEIAGLVGQGLCQKEIAVRLELATKTVDTHVTNLMQKIQAHGRFAVAMWAIAKGLAPCPCGTWWTRYVPA